MKNKKPLLLGALVLLALFILVSLGNWQVRRLAWKNALIEKISSKIEAQPISYWRWRDRQFEPRDYNPSSRPNPLFGHEVTQYDFVKLTGRFDHAREQFVYGLRNGRAGYLVFTPLITKARKFATVFVNRGFIATIKPVRGQTAFSRPTGLVEVRGFIRWPRKASWIDPAANVKEHLWYAPELEKMSGGTDKSVDFSHYIDEKARANLTVWPRGFDPQQLAQSIPNNHLGYIITWYGLALALLGVYGFFLYGQLKKPAESKPAPSPREGQAKEEEL